jgi:hypothetical protein
VSRFIVLAVCAALLTALPAAPSFAQTAPPPIGHWSTTPPTEELWVLANGTCSFVFKGKTTVAGSCTWQGTSRGGILTITYPMPLEPGKVRYNIVWVNRTTITVWGDVMHKRG